MTLDEIDTHCERVRQHYQKRAEWLMLVDLSEVRATAAPASVRKHFAEQTDALHREFPDALRAQAIVIPSSIVRGVMTACEWVRREKPYKVNRVATMEEAEAWLRSPEAY